MRHWALLLLAFLFSSTLYAQYPRATRNLWTRPQVHVRVGDFMVSFTIRDINKALRLLRMYGDSTYAADYKLDTAKDYFYEVHEGEREEYHDELHKMLKEFAGTYLLTEGWALVQDARLRPMPEITVDVGFNALGAETLRINFYDPKSKKLLYSGSMPAALYKIDLGIDDW